MVGLQLFFFILLGFSDSIKYKILRSRQWHSHFDNAAEYV